MRVIHFSDIHASLPLRDLSGWFDKRVLGSLNALLRRRRVHDWDRVAAAVRLIRDQAPDLVVCTGDLVSLGEQAEFDLALADLQPLVDDPRFDLVYVPGNHDYYVNRPVCKARMEHAFDVLNRGRWQLDDLPATMDCNDVRLVVVNEAAPAPLYASSGRLTETDVARLQPILEGLADAGDRLRMCVGHYPMYDDHGRELPWRRRCHGMECLQAALKSGVIDIALCGHIHHHFSRSEENGGTELCAGSLTATGVMNQIDIEPGSRKYNQSWISL